MLVYAVKNKAEKSYITKGKIKLPCVYFKKVTVFFHVFLINTNDTCFLLSSPAQYNTKRQQNRTCSPG